MQSPAKVRRVSCIHTRNLQVYLVPQPFVHSMFGPFTWQEFDDKTDKVRTEILLSHSHRKSGFIIPTNDQFNLICCSTCENSMRQNTSFILRNHSLFMYYWKEFQTNNGIFKKRSGSFALEILIKLRSLHLPLVYCRLSKQLTNLPWWFV